ncbi:MAG: pyrroloquinoline quinone-dependent dehydrogenase [Gemmatimonadetes bacterium]|nr:pyrroloquinoline quinone-dependent dehydrogenase [Gemmatimonadota bacterium]MBK6781035.1 pyrroloquinoline quinone-dependent dehydrogenase [Gemmatimonadota bacterium]MBK7922946.1 pyrroloquinoline quinone-dependent dehydrogenase [Gemmatimonadota bacterium]MBK9690940.1 pyrroloquinoline quinone-dependent dehydrogenase [Gemmatimonadota bacterium]
MDPVSPRISRFRPLGILLVLGLAACSRGPGAAARATSHDTGWGAYGGDPGGGRFSALRQIDTANVGRLALAWTYRTGDATHDDHSEGPGTSCGRCHTGASKFEATPILADGRLYLSTPLNRVIAVDPAAGHELWRFDPGLDLKVERSEGFVSRGVAFWKGPAGSGCASRIFFATVDARLFALDAARGTPCPGFGEAGTVHLDRGVGEVQVGQYGVTSPPAVLGDLVIVGSAIGDNRRVDMERGVVRAFDAVTGAQRWSFDPIPRDPRDPAYASWDTTAARITGGGNAWAPLSVDTALGLVFVPTGSAAPDFFGGLRPGDNRYTSSVVALEGRTGQVRWHFQVVHHDLWDFDVASQPVLVTVPRGGREVPAVAIATKLGHLFVLDRATGTPLFPVEERPVPASEVPGEVAAATQPFPVLPRPLFDGPLTRDSLWGLDDAERDACRAQFDRMRAGPIFTPPSLEGTVMYPGYAGGTTWGSLSWSPERHLLVTNLLRIPLYVKLEPRASASDGNQRGTPYTMSRGMLASPRGLPCNAPPWGSLVAIDLATGERRWQVALGQVPELAAAPGSEAWGSPNMGGSIVTAGGLVFIGAAMDDYLRAFDLETGRELWRGALPAGGQATPMTYAIDGRQYVVIAAGGHGSLGTTFGDHLVAFALPGR